MAAGKKTIAGRLFFYLAVLVVGLSGLTSDYGYSAWSSQVPDSRYLVIIDSSKSVGVEGISRIRFALSEPSRLDDVARTVTLIQYPTAIGPRVLNFDNSAELFFYLSSLKPQKGATDLKQIIDLGQTWSREYSAFDRKVIWIADGGGIARLGSTTQEITQKLETVSPLKSWTIIDLSEQARLSFLTDVTSQYSQLSVDNSGSPIRFDKPSSSFEETESDLISTLQSIARDRESLIFNLVTFILTTLSLTILFRAFLSRSRRSQLEQKRESLIAQFTDRRERDERQNRGMYWEKLPEIVRRPVDKLGVGVNLSEKMRFFILMSSILPFSLLVLIISGSFLAALILGIVTSPLVLNLFISRVEKKEIQEFSKEFPGFLSLLSSGLKSGLSLEQGIDAYCQQNEGITAREFNRVLSEVQLGSSLEDALDDLVTRRNDEDLSWLVTAISIQKSVGGSLSSIIDTVLETIQSRGDVRREIRALSAEGKLSAYVLIALPIFIFSFLFLTRREYVEVLWKESLGLLILFLIGTLITIGWFWMRKVVNIKV